MKTLYESLLDDYKGIEDAANPKNEIKQFLEANYSTPIKQFVISKEPNKNGLYEVICKGKIVKLNNLDTRLTNGMFEFVNRPRKKIKFYCGWGGNLESLKGLPEDIEYLQIMHAPMSSLKDIKGWPDKVEDFTLWCCPNLVSLEGGPKYVDKYLRITACGKKFTKDEVEKYIKLDPAADCSLI